MGLIAEAEPEAPDTETVSEGFACPEEGCGKVLPTARGLNLHMLRKHGVRTESEGSKKPPKPRKQALGAKDLDELNDRLHGHLTIIGTIVSAVLPHTGLTIVSRTPDRSSVIESADGVERVIRRKGIVSLLMGYAQKDERILKGLLAFDRIMTSGDEVAIVGGLASAIAVDTGRVDPHAGIGIPGTPMRLAPDMFIGDVIESYEAQMAEDGDEETRYHEARRQEDYPSNGQATTPSDATVIHGGVKAT